MEPSEIDPSLDRLWTASDQFCQLVLCQALADARACFAQAPEPLPNGRHRAMEPFCDEANVLASREIEQALLLNWSPLSGRYRTLLGQAQLSGPIPAGLPGPSSTSLNPINRCSLSRKPGPISLFEEQVQFGGPGILPPSLFNHVWVITHLFRKDPSSTGVLRRVKRDHIKNGAADREPPFCRFHGCSPFLLSAP